MGIAGLWDTWKKPDGSWLMSYTMLTINADEHPLMRDFHKPADEKRMVVILPESSYEGWLSAPAKESAAYLNPFSAADLVARPQLVSGRSG
jgi:putative SOS response-associated peptidase YedK